MKRRGALVGYAVVMTLVGIACGGNGGSPGGGALTMAIEEPADGAEVPSDFTVRFSSSAELGPTDTGAHHVHLFVDGNEDDYDVVESGSFEVSGLSAGDHTLTASLRNADHSAAGAEDEIAVTVTGSGGDGGDGGDGGYNY